MARRHPASKPTWTDVKAELASFDRVGLLALIQELYAAYKDNQSFLHARFRLGEDVLKPYKEMLDRWLWPDILRNQDTSVVKAKQAISSYKKAVGDPAGLAELMVFYCERAAGFSNDIGYQNDTYFDALVRMFDQSLSTVAQLSGSDRNALIARLNKVRTISHNFGYGVGDDMDSLFAKWLRKSPKPPAGDKPNAWLTETSRNFPAFDPHLAPYQLFSSRPSAEPNVRGSRSIQANPRFPSPSPIFAQRDRGSETRPFTSASYSRSDAERRSES